jgi:large subunit ribosomal protein L10
MAYEIRKLQQYKIDAVNALKEQFEGSKDYIFTDYRGLTVEQITQLREKLREQNAEYRVVKNRFAKIALKEMHYDNLEEYLVGPTAVALSKDESGPIAKTLFDFGKDAPLEVKGGIIDGQVFTFEDVEAYSKLPTRDELLAKLMGTMNAPVQNLASVLQQIPSKLVRTLQAVADAKQGE